MSGFHKPTMKPALAASVLQDLGYRGKITLDDGYTYVQSAANGLKFFVNFLLPVDGDPENGYESIQFETGFSLGDGINTAKLIERCNAFNQIHRYGKVALCGTKRFFVTLKVDIPVVSDDPAWFGSWVESFINFTDTFTTEIVNTDYCQSDGCGELHSEAIQALYGAERKPEMAIDLYRRAAHKGYAGSQNNLGDQYERGDHIPKSDLFAIYWYTRAAERGEPTAYLSLATLLSANSADFDMKIEAAKYAYLAIASLPSGFNMSIAKACLEQLKESLTDDDLALAEERVKAWLPLYQETRLMSDSPRSEEPADEQVLLLH